jgi:hypothetical protein
MISRCRAGSFETRISSPRQTGKLRRTHESALRAFARSVFWILSVGAYILNGQQASEIVTDRPDVTEASTVVPKDGLQIENGFTQTSDHGTGTPDLSESLVRYGLSDRTELRFLMSPTIFPRYRRATGAWTFGPVVWNKTAAWPVARELRRSRDRRTELPHGHRERIKSRL